LKDEGNNLFSTNIDGEKWYQEGVMSVKDTKLRMKELYGISFYNYNPKERDIVFIVGAHIGHEIFYMPRFKTNIHAFEPHPKSCSILKMNVGFNDDVHINCTSVSDYIGDSWISNTNDSVANSTVEKNMGIHVSSTTLEKYILDNNIKRINLLKINIEGDEVKSLNGLGDMIEIVDNFAVSCHDFLYSRTGNTKYKTKKDVISFLGENGFKVTTRNTGIDYVDDWVYAENTNPKY